MSGPEGPKSGSGAPPNQFAYVMAKGEGNKGASYKYKWRPDWRLPPGVNQRKVVLQVGVCLCLAAIPVWGLPYLRRNEPVQPKKEDAYMATKKKNREERMKWIESDDMPYK
mmetsp:Transcript_19070/g.32671  ORF Transcript_19070/g.32671 Transcript_19070/m.32671 type:complete len:111 (-) Transcript_19070:1024-1356(-)